MRSTNTGAWRYADLCVPLAVMALVLAVQPLSATDAAGNQKTTPEMKVTESGEKNNSAAEAKKEPVACGTARMTGAYEDTSKSNEVGLGQVLTVELTGLPALRACKKPIVLFLDDRPLKELSEYPPTDSESKLRFTLKLPPDSDTTADAKASRASRPPGGSFSSSPPIFSSV